MYLFGAYVYDLMLSIAIILTGNAVIFLNLSPRIIVAMFKAKEGKEEQWGFTPVERIERALKRQFTALKSKVQPYANNNHNHSNINILFHFHQCFIIHCITSPSFITFDTNTLL